MGRDGKPHVVPVGFRLDSAGTAIEIGGQDLAGSKKWRDLQAIASIAVIIDDLASVNPWTPRGVEVRGRAELVEQGGHRFGPGWGAV